MGNKSILGHLHTHHAPVSHDPIAAVTQNISQSIHLERARWVLSLSLSLSLSLFPDGFYRPQTNTFQAISPLSAFLVHLALFPISPA